MEGRRYPRCTPVGHQRGPVPPIELTGNNFESSVEENAPTGAVSLSGLFNGELPKTDLAAAPDLDTVIDNLLRPGFPAMTALSPTQSADRLRGYIDDVARTDIHRIAEIRHEPEDPRRAVRERGRP